MLYNEEVWIGGVSVGLSCFEPHSVYRHYDIRWEGFRDFFSFNISNVFSSPHTSPLKKCRETDRWTESVANIFSRKLSRCTDQFLIEFRKLSSMICIPNLRLCVLFCHMTAPAWCLLWVVRQSNKKNACISFRTLVLNFVITTKLSYNNIIW